MTDIVERLNDSLSAGYDSLSAGYSELRKEAAEEIMRLRAKTAPSINEGVRKVTLSFRWESEAQHHIPTIEIEFDPVAPNDAKGWQDRDRIAVMLTPEAKS